MKINLEIEFELGEIVYLITDKEQNERIVSGLTLRPNKTILYTLACGSYESTHFEIEINRNKNYKL